MVNMVAIEKKSPTLPGKTANHQSIKTDVSLGQSSVPEPTSKKVLLLQFKLRKQKLWYSSCQVS